MQLKSPLFHEARLIVSSRGLTSVDKSCHCHSDIERSESPPNEQKSVRDFNINVRGVVN